jgi:hypothetical protein
MLYKEVKKRQKYQAKDNENTSRLSHPLYARTQYLIL